MIPLISILAAIASAVGVYWFFFEGPKELMEYFVVYLTAGSGRDYRITLMMVSFIAGGLLTYLFLLHIMGKPLSIPFI